MAGARPRFPLTVDWQRLPGLLRASRYLFVVWAATQVFHRVDIYFIEIFSTTTSVGLYEQALLLRLPGRADRDPEATAAGAGRIP